MRSRPSSLEDAITFALAAHDPLDPWLINSNYDQDYWRAEAQAAVPQVAKAGGPEDVYNGLVLAMRAMVRPPEDDSHIRERLTAAAEAVWRWLLSDRAQNTRPDP